VFFNASWHEGELRVIGVDGKGMALRYRLDRSVRALVMWVINRITPISIEQSVDFRRQDIKKILLVRGLFRMGDLILATPAILLFRENFPTARIDFVGSVLSKALFQGLPLDHHYEVYRSFPKVLWSYVALLKRIRSGSYDLAVDVSGSNSAMGAFIVGLSAARFRVGLKGKWDRWFNVRLQRPATINKYQNLPELIASMGLVSRVLFPKIVLAAAEIEEGRMRIQSLLPRGTAPIVGVFVGGRKTRGKRWAKENFLEVVIQLRGDGVRPIIFVGPEEQDMIPYFQEALGHRTPVIFEPNARIFASLLANCHLFVACDSGPVHLACALRVRTIAIFLRKDFYRWGPPNDLGRIVCRDAGAAVEDVLEMCLHELNDRCADREQRQTVNH
jgi:lipopolysaccharide heptosyltransferase II